MAYKALCSFSGKVSMAEGEIKDIKDERIIKDLLRARYIEEVKVIDSAKETKPKKKKTPKKKKEVTENDESDT